MEVKIGKLVGFQDTPLGPVEQESLMVWRVDVIDEALTRYPLRIAAGSLMVGTIGRQDGANFCANSSFGLFAASQQEQIVSEVKRLHGKACPDPPVELPIIPDEENEEFDDEDTETIDE